MCQLSTNGCPLCCPRRHQHQRSCIPNRHLGYLCSCGCSRSFLFADVSGWEGGVDAPHGLPPNTILRFVSEWKVWKITALISLLYILILIDRKRRERNVDAPYGLSLVGGLLHGGGLPLGSTKQGSKVRVCMHVCIYVWMWLIEGIDERMYHSWDYFMAVAFLYCSTKQGSKVGVCMHVCIYVCFYVVERMEWQCCTHSRSSELYSCYLCLWWLFWLRQFGWFNINTSSREGQKSFLPSIVPRNGDKSLISCSFQSWYPPLYILTWATSLILFCFPKGIYTITLLSTHCCIDNIPFDLRPALTCTPSHSVPSFHTPPLRSLSFPSFHTPPLRSLSFPSFHTLFLLFTLFILFTLHPFFSHSTPSFHTPSLLSLSLPWIARKLVRALWTRRTRSSALVRLSAKSMQPNVLC